MTDPTRVPNTGPTSGWEKGHLICPNCKARNSMEFRERTHFIQGLDGSKKYDGSKREGSHCASCGVSYPNGFRFERVG